MVNSPDSDTAQVFSDTARNMADSCISHRAGQRSRGTPVIYSVGSTLLFVLFGWMVLMTQSVRAGGESDTAGHAPFRLHVVFNNVPHKAGLESGWGFACLIESPEQTVLFDTGGDGGILLSNMQHMGLDPSSVDAVVLSHIHSDHTGGLEAFLVQNPNVTVYTRCIISGSIPTRG